MTKVAKAKPIPKLPPRTARQCWGEFLKWALGVPVVIFGSLAIIGGAVWLAGGQDLMWRTTATMGEALLYIGGLLLLYPLLMIMWVAELQVGLRAARDWAALPPEAQKAAIAEGKAALKADRDRRQERRAQKAGAAK